MAKIVGLIPAAGISSRLFPETKVINKLLMPIVDKPVVHYLVEEFIQAGITEIYITGRHLTHVKNYFQENPNLLELAKKVGHKGSADKLRSTNLKVKLNFITQSIPRGWMHEVKLVSKEIGNASLAVSLSDLLYDSKVPAMKQLVKLFRSSKKTIKSGGRYIISSKSMKLVKTYNPKTGDDAETVNDFFSEVQSKGDLELTSINGMIIDVGSTMSWMKANTMFMLKSKEYKDEYSLFLNNLKNEVQ